MWQLLFWGSIAVVLYTYVGYPILLAILSVLRGKRTLSDQSARPSICLIISAFNERRVIRQKIENSLALQYPRDLLRIVVASDGSDDGTVEIVEEYAGQGVRLVHHAHRRGKSVMLGDVVPNVQEEIVVFTDANALFAEDAIAKLVRGFADPMTGCVVGKLRYTDGDATSVGKGEGAYWRYESWLSRMESRLQSVLIANGSIFAIRRELFRELYADVANDLQIPMDVANQNRGVLYDPEAIATEQTAAVWFEEFERKSRIVLRGLTGFATLRRRMRGMRLWQFVSRKLLRWTVGAFAAIAFVANTILAADSLAYTALLAGQVVFYFCAMLGWMKKGDVSPNRLFYIPFYFTMVNSAALFAIAAFLAGRRQRTWEKAESTRQSRPSATAGDSDDDVVADVDMKAEVFKG